jgi:putative hydrolase of HD superfamily
MTTNQQAATAEAVARRQLEAYNARDIDAFMAEWAEDAQYFAFPATLLASGAAAIRARHVERFREAGLHGELLQRMVVGNLVVDQERVRRTFPEGPGAVDVIAIYEVEDGKIAKAWFRMGETVLDAPG